MPGEMDILKIPDMVIAEQLTFIDAELFKSVQVRCSATVYSVPCDVCSRFACVGTKLCTQKEELLNQAWSKPKLMYRAHNIIALVERLNNLTNWVCQHVAQGERECVGAKESIATASV